MSIKNNYKVDLVKIEDIIITNARIDNNSQITVLEKGKYIYDKVNTSTFCRFKMTGNKNVE